MTDNRYEGFVPRRRARCVAEDDPAGVARLAPASNTPSLRTGRSASSITICSCGTNNYAFDFLGVNTRNDDIEQDADLVTARINYRFGGPAVARY